MEFTKSDVRLMDIMSNLLEFNLWYRESAGTLLQSPLFDSVRNAEREKPAPFKIQLNIDAQNPFNYAEKEYNEGVSLLTMKQMLRDEIKLAKALKRMK
mmetsp:Transcript_1350/g.2397  ORF Transcript_1350/g.2397 Transcript_1350/m.2397 type:complete len:98 (+) Transcript_1350:298-591(+)